jgi:phenylacetate-CoA ligase
MLNSIYRLHWHLSRAFEFPGIHRKLGELREEGRLSLHERKILFEQRLRKLLIFAREHVSYYKKVFGRIGFNPESADLPSDINKIPILTKCLIRENLGELIADTADQSHLLKNATGGSTGVPLKFYQDQEYWTVATAIDTYVKEWWGIEAHDRKASVWGADREFSDLSFKERLYSWRYRSRSINAFRMNDESLLKFCEMLQRWRPPYLTGYSSALEALARFAKKHGVRNLRFKAIRSTAEMLWPHQRKLIEETFNSPVYNFYGSREVNNLAAECPEERRLHLISTWRYIEIIDDEGKVVPEGETGYITVTDLSNYAMPFIRYQNEDVGILDPRPCPCGRPSPVLKELLGRSADLIRTPRGDIIHGEFFTHLFYGRDDIRQFQVHQKALDHLIVRYIPNENPSAKDMKRIIGEIRARIGDEVTIDLEVCSQIPIPPGGKHRFTISDVRM